MYLPNEIMFYPFLVYEFTSYEQAAEFIADWIKVQKHNATVIFLF